MPTPLPSLKCVAIETPCAGHPPEWLPKWLAKWAEWAERRIFNERYTALCMRDSLMRGEAPYASQFMYDRVGVLDDANPEHRHLGMACGIVWTSRAVLMAVYCDHGVSRGMREAMKFALANGIPVEKRHILSSALAKGRVTPSAMAS